MDRVETAPAQFVYSPRFSRYRLSEYHPMKPIRLRMTYELLSAYGALSPPRAALAEPRLATVEELLSAHEREFVEVTRRLGNGEDVPDAWLYGYGPGDNPPFAGMFDAGLLYTGASLTAGEAVLAGARAAFNISGGLHHAMADRASGFCIFNDPVVLIHRLLSQCGRVAYVDIDAHHGDGVQAAFYESDRVLTVSVHEGGEFLFPGTGRPEEVGEGAGSGYAANVPLAPGTGDDTFVWVIEEVVAPLVESHAPDVIVAQLGTDAHYLDPLAHLSLTTHGYERTFELIMRLGRPVVALGGGGYDVGVVARVWALAFAALSGKQLADDIPEPYAEAWGSRRLRDETQAPGAEPHAERARRYAEDSVRRLKAALAPRHRL
jgi:acetoin utilization protein AcuC